MLWWSESENTFVFWENTSWLKTKTELCNKLLDSTTVSEHEAQLFCTKCHARKYGPKGVGFGIGAGTLTMDTGEKFGNREVEMTYVLRSRVEVSESELFMTKHIFPLLSLFEKNDSSQLPENTQGCFRWPGKRPEFQSKINEENNK